MARVAAATAGSPIRVTLEDGDTIELATEDLDIRIHQREGTTSSYDEAMLVALDTELTEDLIQEGLAREVINRIQTARKDLDLAYDDRIDLRWEAGSAIADALAVHGELVASEVLASSFERQAHPNARTERIRDEDLSIHIEVSAK